MQAAITAKFKEAFFSLSPLQQAGFFLWPSMGARELSPQEEKAFAELKPSGCVFFKRNLQSVEQSQQLISQIKSLSKKENIFANMNFVAAIDEEGGRVSRLPSPYVRGKPALEFAEGNDEEGLKQQVLYQARAAKNLGINCILAPVADILTEPTNPVMGDRCYGRDAETVTRFSSIVNKTLLSEKIYSCAKHFPGHGNTTTDSHMELSVSDVNLSTLQYREWVPFQTLIAEHVSFIMAAHVIVPQVDSGFPATLSYEILTNHLRNKLNFTGLILSDDLRMNGIADHYNVKRQLESSITEDENVFSDEFDAFLDLAAVDALQAGCDILLSCQSVVREMRIAHAITKKMLEDENFKSLLVEKAWRIYNTLTTK